MGKWSGSRLTPTRWTCRFNEAPRPEWGHEGSIIPPRSHSPAPRLRAVGIRVVMHESPENATQTALIRTDAPLTAPGFCQYSTSTVASQLRERARVGVGRDPLHFPTPDVGPHSVPHPRGDVPAHSRHSGLVMSCSPPAWGCTDLLPDDTGDLRLFPTNVGIEIEGQGWPLLN